VVVVASHRRRSPEDWLRDFPEMLWKRTPTRMRFVLRELKGALFHIWFFYWTSSDAMGIAYPSAKTISKYTGYSGKIITQARSALVRNGWLVPVGEQQRNGYKFGPKRFLVVLPEREEVVGRKLHHDS